MERERILRQMNKRDRRKMINRVKVNLKEQISKCINRSTMILVESADVSKILNCRHL